MPYQYTPFFRCRYCGYDLRAETVEVKTKAKIEAIVAGETEPEPPKELHQCSQNSGRSHYGKLEFAGIIVPTADLPRGRKP